LSSARAISVVQYLIGKGISPQLLVAAGFGEFQPLDAAGSEEAFRRNRRIACLAPLKAPVAPAHNVWTAVRLCPMRYASRNSRRTGSGADNVALLQHFENF